MPDSISIKVEGLAQLDKALRNLPAVVQQRALRKALKSGADIIRDAARDLTPQGKTGQLKRDIKTKVSLSIASASDRAFLEAAGEGDAPDAAIATISVTGKSAAKAHLTEFGAAAHPIKAKRRKVLANVGEQKVFGRAVAHPGAKAKPFMRPAFDTRAEAALSEITSVLRQEVESTDFTQGVAASAGIELED